MITATELENRIFSVTESDFDELALDIFRYQALYNPVYCTFLTYLDIVPAAIMNVAEIPFLPVSTFKQHKIITGSREPQLIFESSGTTGSINSKHYITNSELYQQSFQRTFEQYYGNVSDYLIIGLLPSYLERGNSSLVYMTDALIQKSGDERSGFFLKDFTKLAGLLKQAENDRKKSLLIGVTYALLDFAEMFPMELKHTIVMETGGMKGRRNELTRREVHGILKEKLGLTTIHSEYGMTELLSQAYASEDGVFKCPPWMEILIRAEDDPFQISSSSGSAPVTGIGNIIDLANVNSCCFLATDDLMTLYPDGSFEVLGRVDNSDIRGCSLLSL